MGLPGTYMKVYHFEREQTACPGFLIMVHPKMVWKETLVKELKQAIKEVKVPATNKIVERWKNNRVNDTPTQAIPFFTLQPTMRKMKGSQAEVLNVISAQRDAELLKMLLSKSGETVNHSKWLFVPTGLHLIETTDLVKAILRQQNAFIQSVTSVAIEGITEETMMTGGEDGRPLIDEMKETCTGVKTIERTTLTEQRGRWLIIVDKENQDEVKSYVVKDLVPKLERRETNGVIGIQAGVAGSFMGSTTVGSYAAVLRNRLTTTAMDDTNEKFDIGRRFPKRRHIIPVATDIITQENQPKKTPSVTQSQVYQPSPPEFSKGDLTTWEMKMESKMNEKFKSFEEQQTKRLDEFESQIHKTVGKLLELATDRLQTTMDGQFKSVTDTIMGQLRQMQGPAQPMGMVQGPPQPMGMVHGTLQPMGMVHGPPPYNIPPSPYDTQQPGMGEGLSFNPYTNRYERPSQTSSIASSSSIGAGKS